MKKDTCTFANRNPCCCEMTTTAAAHHHRKTNMLRLCHCAGNERAVLPNDGGRMYGA